MCIRDRARVLSKTCHRRVESEVRGVLRRADNSRRVKECKGETMASSQGKDSKQGLEVRAL